MTPEKYREMRKEIGTQEEVADLLEVSRVTMTRRENGGPVSLEIEFALRWLRKKELRKRKPDSHAEIPDPDPEPESGPVVDTRRPEERFSAVLEEWVKGPKTRR